MKISIPPHPRQHLLFHFLFVFLIAILTGVKSYLVAVLICISLMTIDVEHLFIFLAVCISYLDTESF